MALDPLAAYQAYKNQQQQTNSSDNSYNYNAYSKPSYYGATSPPPVITARDVLAQRDSIQQGPPPSSIQEKSIFDSSLPTAEKIGIGGAASSISKVIYSNDKPTYSAGTRSFNADTTQTLSQLNEAKNAGLTSLQLYDSKGNKISDLGLVDSKGNKISGIINPQDIVRARYDILNASLLTGGPVSAKGSTTTSFTKTTSTSEPEYFRKDDSFLKSLGAGIAGTLGYVGLSIMSVPKDISLIAQGKYDKAAQQKGEQDVIQQVQKSVGPTYLDQILQGNYKSENLTPEEKAGSLIGSGVGLYLLGGGSTFKAGLANRIGSTLKNIPGYLRDLPKGITTNEGVVSKVASGLKEGSIIQNVGPRELVTGIKEKGTPIREVAQGTVGKSGIESYRPEKVQGFIDQLPGGKVQATGPAPLPKGISESTDVIGIGAKGQPKTFTKPTEITLEPGLEGEAKNPYALINPKGATAIVRSTPNDVLPPDKLLVEFQGITPLEAAGQAAHYGLEEVPGMKNVYFGKATPHNVSMLEQGVQAGKIKLGTDIFQYGSKEFASHPQIYGEVTRNPELFQSKAFGKGGAFESVTRPSVLRYLIGRGATEVKAPKIGPNSLVRNKKIRPMTGGDFGIGEIGSGKVGAGASGRAIALLKNTESIAKDFGKVTTSQGSKIRYDTFGPVLSLEERRGRGRRSSNDLEIETIRYPNIVSVDQIGRIKTKGGQRNNLQSDIGLAQINEMIGQTKNNSLLNLSKLGSTTQTKTRSGLDTIVIPRIGLDTGLTTKQITKQTTDLITITDQVPKRTPYPPGPKIVGGLWFGIPGYPSGRNKKRGYRSRATFFTYSVNPNVVGAIAEAGQPGKIVSGNPIRFKGFGKVKGPNLGKIGKGIGLSGGRRGKKDNLDNIINLRF